MARPRKPTNVLHLSGALAKNPKRYEDRANEPDVIEPLGPPPETLKPVERAAWMEIDRLAPWLRAPDRLFVELAAQMLGAYRTLGIVGMPSHLVGRMESILSKLGFAATERSKIVDVTSGKGKNKFANNGKR